MKNQGWSSRHFTAFGIIGVLIGSAILGVGAYWAFFVPKTGPKASIVSYPLQVSIALDKSDYSEGENISITCALKNVCSSNVSLSFANEVGYYDEEDRRYHLVLVDYAIFDSNGTEVFRWSHHSGALPSVKYVTLEPGQEQSNTFKFIMEYDTLTETGGRLPPGNYQIRGIMPPDKPAIIVDYDGNRATIKMETPSISFTIG